VTIERESYLRWSKPNFCHTNVLNAWNRLKRLQNRKDWTKHGQCNFLISYSAKIKILQNFATFYLSSPVKCFCSIFRLTILSILFLFNLLELSSNKRSTKGFEQFYLKGHSKPWQTCGLLLILSTLTLSLYNSVSQRC